MIRPYANYKDSGIAWLGGIPSHWSIDRFKWSVSSCRNGIWGEEPDGGNDDIVCVRVADFDRISRQVRLDDPTLRKISDKERTGRLLEKGNLLLEKSGGGEGQPVGAVVIYDDERPAVCSNFVARMVLTPEGDPRFWLYVHATAYGVRLTVRSIKQTSGIQNLDQTQYLDELAPFPPLSEQRAIAAFLDRETGKIDALVEEQRKLIELLREKRQAVISHAVPKGLNSNVVFKPSGVKWLGNIPAHWKTRRISKVSSKITNDYVGPTREIFQDQGVRYLQSLHIKSNKIAFQPPYFVGQEWSEKHAKSILKAEDVLIVQTGDIGQVAVVPADFEGCNCHALIIVTPIKKFLSGHWLSWVLCSDYGYHSLLSIQTGALHPHLNCGNVKYISIPLPPIDEQGKIMEAMGAELERLDSLILEAVTAIDLLKERRISLISAAVTGKIDVRGEVPEETEAA